LATIATTLETTSKIQLLLQHFRSSQNLHNPSKISSYFLTRIMINVSGQAPEFSNDPIQMKERQ
jgi:hypothetical protein